MYGHSSVKHASILTFDENRIVVPLEPVLEHAKKTSGT